MEFGVLANGKYKHGFGLHVTLLLHCLSTVSRWHTDRPCLPGGAVSGLFSIILDT